MSDYSSRTQRKPRRWGILLEEIAVNIHQVDYTFIDTDRYLEDSRTFRLGEPSGMLVAIAALARLTQRAAARLEGWARRPEQVEYLPRIPVR